MSVYRYSQRRRLALLGGVTIVFALGIGLGRHIPAASSHTAEQSVPEAVPAFVRQGDKIIIPRGSALRTKLAVQAVAAKSGPHVLSLPAGVETDPAHTVNILPPVAGKVVKLMVQLGNHVTKGQPLAVIESGDLAQAYADDEKARDALQHAERTLERVRGLNKAGAGAVKDREQAESDYAQAKAEANRAEARLRQIGATLQPKGKQRFLPLTAPMSGTVTAITTSTGAFANDPTASLMTIANLDTVWVTASVPESDIAHIAKGESADISFPAYPGEIFHGTVAFVNDVLEPDTRRAKVRITFANPAGKLKPNMFATANFRIPQKSAVFVPNAALLMDNDSTIVFVEVAPWAFVKRAVVPGYGEGDGARIDRGLNPGDRIIVAGGVLLND